MDAKDTDAPRSEWALPRPNVKDCLGNRIEVDEDEDVGIVFHVGHGKTERWQTKDFQYSIAVPEGQFSDLLRLHIAQGQAIMTSHIYEGHSVDRLFVNNSGKLTCLFACRYVFYKLYDYNRLNFPMLLPPNCIKSITYLKCFPFVGLTFCGPGKSGHARFTQYWATALKCAGFYFCPQEGRTTYIADAMRTLPPQVWPGAASIMGNSVKQWEKSYNPTLKQQRIDATLAALHNDD
jgi:hypothetical protein